MASSVRCRTFMNYTFQSFNFRGRSEMRPFYDLIANIAAEEFGHIELVSYAINLLLTGTTERGERPRRHPARLGGRCPQHLPLPRERPAGAARWTPRATSGRAPTSSPAAT